MSEVTIEKIVSLSKRRGFIFQNSELYGGLASSWDYGPLGVELKKNIKDAWWRAMVYERDDVFGLDSAILMHPRIWEASGHAQNFADPFLSCSHCDKYYRQDNPEIVNGLCPSCGKPLSGEVTYANLMLKTHLGPIEETALKVFLRPETAQGIFVNFANILAAKHPKLPFGIAQIGKAFRNEITTGNFTFRSREFEQMELEYFVRPEEDKEYYDFWIQERFNWYIRLGINRDNLRLREHAEDELAHYAKACTDIEYHFPFGWMELEGIANRTDFDLRQHSKFSGIELSYFDEQKRDIFFPYIIEPSGGVDRSLLAFLIDAYREEKVKGEKRVVLGLDKKLAPIKVAVLPLLSNRSEIVEMARKIYEDLRAYFVVTYDDTASIGRLYRRQDEIGTVYCVTVDVQSLVDKQVTIRDRDTMLQDRISIDKLKEYLDSKFNIG
ncbi:MAG: glycine--tRNA ligase [Candidatus Omnitrophica bacterium]|nr:glycine--tRNA ligase [Candidatus Omnitrophota bacterium]